MLPESIKENVAVGMASVNIKSDNIVQVWKQPLTAHAFLGYKYFSFQQS